MPRGTRRFDAETVRQIRRDHAAGASIKGLAGRHGIDRHSIRLIVKCRTYKEVPATTS